MIVRRILSASRSSRGLLRRIEIPRRSPPSITRIAAQCPPYYSRLHAHFSTASESAPASAPKEPTYLSDVERRIFSKLVAELEPTSLEVQDISGGCGSMFAIEIASARFKGLGMVQQHRLVNKVLKTEIGEWHGLQLKTREA